MSNYFYIKKEKVKSLIEKLEKDYDLFIPLEDKKSGIVDFYNLSNLTGNLGVDFELNFAEKTKKSPKSIFFPQTENIFEFEYLKNLEKPDEVKINLKENIITSKKDFRKKILFGLKPCDTFGIKCMDLWFGEGEKKDPNYFYRRKNSLIISIGCHLIFPDCFCVAVGGSPFSFDYSDIGLIDMGDIFLVLKISKKKEIEEFLKENKDFFEEKDLSLEDENKIKEIMSTSEEKCSLNWKKINPDEVIDLMYKKFGDEKKWKNVTNKCISCGACTYVCPTCICFSIGDEIKDISGVRYKCWDFCTNYYYTLEASGHNPRSKIFQRYRNKINCKYNYFYRRNKNIYCVGCGRCIDVCPVGMDIREIVGEFL